MHYIHCTFESFKENFYALLQWILFFGMKVGQSIYLLALAFCEVVLGI